MDVLEEDRKYVQFWSAIGTDEDEIICRLLVRGFSRKGILNEKCCIPLIGYSILKYKDMFGYHLENGELQSVAEFVHDNMVK